MEEELTFEPVKENILDVIKPLFSLACLTADDDSDLLLLSCCCHSEINFYHEYVCVSEEMVRSMYSQTTKQNNVTWKKFRQVSTNVQCNLYFQY